VADTENPGIPGAPMPTGQPSQRFENREKLRFSLQPEAAAAALRHRGAARAPSWILQQSARRHQGRL